MKKELSVFFSFIILLFFCMSVDYAKGQGAPKNPMASQNKINVPEDYTTIQGAVNAVTDEGSIFVHSGDYYECVTIDGKDISLVAVGNVTLIPTACGGHGDAIQVYNGSACIIGFNIDATNCKGGIYAKGGFEGFGPVTVSVLNNTVYSYQKNGITVNGSEAYGHIVDNTIQGSGPIGVPYYAQNGIQFGWGATGIAMRNTVEGNWYTGPDWAACGILIFQSDGVLVQNNTVENCGTGIAIETWCYAGFYPSASFNKVIQNTIEGADYGISIAAYDFYSEGDAYAENNKVTNNYITSSSGAIGIFVGTASYGYGYIPIAYNNKIIHNTIEGFATLIEEDGTATKVHANVIW